MRDYKKDPLKHNEPIPKEEMYELYINQNYSRTMLQEYFNVGRTKVFQYLKKYGFEKSAEQRVKAFETALENKGYTNNVSIRVIPDEKNIFRVVVDQEREQYTRTGNPVFVH